jgi:hypothetical protein
MVRAFFSTNDVTTTRSRVYGENKLEQDTYVCGQASHRNRVGSGLGLSVEAHSNHVFLEI